MTTQDQQNEQARPAVRIIRQYIKDFSFENTGLPDNMPEKNPEVRIEVNTKTRTLENDQYENVLNLKITAAHEEKTVFVAELAYAGLVQVGNVPQDKLAPLMGIELPRLLFPFARQILATTMQESGFPPLMLEPIDFAHIYRQAQEQQKNKAEKQADVLDEVYDPSLN